MESRIWIIIALLPLIMVVALFLKRGQSGEVGSHQPMSSTKLTIKIAALVALLAISAAVYAYFAISNNG